MTKYTFTPEDYASLAKAIRESDEWRDEGIRERLTLELDSPNVRIVLTRYVSGHWEVGGTYDGICGHEEERLYTVDGEAYEVRGFESFDADDWCQDSDFDARRLCEILDWPKAKRRAA